MAWPKAMPIVEVEWIDSSCDAGWGDVDGPKAEDHDLGCATAGYLVRKTKDRVVIALSQSSSSNLGDTMHIPRCAIRKMTILKPAKPRSIGKH